MKQHRCMKCGGPVIPGVNGFIRGLTTTMDSNPFVGRIRDSEDCIHYADDCGEPNVIAPFPRLGGLDEVKESGK